MIRTLVALVLLLPAVTVHADRPTEVVVYNGFGTPTRALVSGRVQELSRSAGPTRGEGAWATMKRNVRMLESDELGGVRLTLTAGGKSRKTTTDKEGLFSVYFQGLKPGKHKVKVVVKGQPRAVIRPGKVLVSPTKPGVAVVSDIDDTVLDTGVTSTWKLVQRALFKNAHDLRTFKGAPELYRAWSARGYPLVFLSGSPINFYGQLCRFLKLRRFPVAPLLLKNMGVSAGSDPLKEQVSYKTRRVEQVRTLLPGYRLLLVGDAGEKDADIYRAVARKHPKEVVAIMIRKVDGRCPAPGKPAVICFGTHRELADLLAKRGLITKVERTAVVEAGK